MASQAEEQFLQSAFHADCRPDGRTRDEYRVVNVATGFLAQCNGSARVQIGATDVVVGVKVELGTPSTARPDCGCLEVCVASSAVADAGNQGRGSDAKDAAMAGALIEAIEGPAGGTGVGLDLTTLCIAKGKKCWQLYIDCVVLNDDGNALDALAAAVRAALMRTGIPSVQVAVADGDAEGEVEVDGDQTTPLEGSGAPLMVTVHRCGAASVVDVREAEAGCLQDAGALQVAVSPQGTVCGVTKMGPGGLDPAVMLALDVQLEHEAAEEADDDAMT